MFGVSECVKQVEETSNNINFIGFSHEDFGEVRIVMLNNSPWFVAADVCRVIGIKNSRDATAKLKENEKELIKVSCKHGGVRKPGGAQFMTIINEFGLCRLILRSRKKAAEKFQDWILYGTLPFIRKYGAYINVSHSDIRQLSKDVRNKLESAISILIKCRIDELPAIAEAIKSSGYNFAKNISTKDIENAKDAVYKFITSRINKAVGLKSHERDKTDTKTLLNLILYEAYAIEAILKGLYTDKSLQHIINLCGYKVEKKLGMFEYYESVAS